MKTLLKIIFLNAVFLLPVQAQTYAPAVTVCYADGVQYESTISLESVLSSPAWRPSEALPISFERAIQIAHAALGKIVKNPEVWNCQSISLEHLRGSNPERWYFDIRFGEEVRRDQINPSFRPQTMHVSVDFGGRPGSIKPKQKQ